jgi:primary-amine oxidase
VTYDPAHQRTCIVTVSLDDGVTVRAQHIPDAQPQVTAQEWVANGEQIKADPRFRRALARRGIHDTSRVFIEPWPAGNFGLDVDKPGRRLARGVAYLLDGPGDNPYAHPIENLVAVADRDTGELVELHDGEVVPVPMGSGRYDRASVGASRTLAPLEITQPEGSGIAVDGDGALRWGPWSMRVTMHPVEGLVLHQIGYTDDGRVRPILYRASMTEMVVPYGSTAANHWWKNAFDAGDAGLGISASSLEYGCDCLGEIIYLDAVMANPDGSGRLVERAICLHEEDYGILWKHHDNASGKSEVRRSRRLVVSFFATVGNYDYGFFWYFYLDGTIAAEVKLTGMVLAQATAPGEHVPHAVPITPELAGVHHQHLFSFRLDMCIDGPLNSVYEVDAVPVPPGPDNPYGNAFDSRATLLERESSAQRMAAPERFRFWKIVNHSARNACGDPVGYKLVPTHPAALLAGPAASVTARAAFATRHLWVTAFDPQERRAAGDFPNQHPGGAGLPEWTAADRPLVNADVVLWHTVGSTHFCRPEDFPVMPCDYVGFMLKPVGFFARNPAIDLA